ncbi:hypothetical protein C0J52_12152 [Blattella germanica]|nr:hypothetical protein C0J52_12152 [Blattella germanica]
MFLSEEKKKTEHCLEPINPSFLSSDVFTPDSLPHTSYGTHYKEYGGIGDRDFLGEKHLKEPSWPRSHRHFKSGFKERFFDIKVEPITLEHWLQRERANWVDAPGKNAPFLYEIFKRFNTTTKAEDQQRNWWLQAPFWWHGQPYGKRGSVGHPNDYSYSKFTHFDVDPPNLREDIEVERPERYIPGQIHAKGPLDTRQPCQCPAVKVDDKNRYPVYRGPGHWPASAMGERRQYADRGSADDEDKTCPLYSQNKEVGEIFGTSMKGRGQEPCPYYASPSYETGKKKNVCTCKKLDKRISMKPEECSNQVLTEEDLCPVHTQKIDVSCPFEPGRPCPASGGILSGAACFDSPEQQRKFQLYKVGTPFRTEACQWYNKNFPMEKLAPVERPEKKTFPEMRFSNLYINYSNIAARLLRQALKADLKTEALKREESYIRFTPWKDGKAQSTK